MAESEQVYCWVKQTLMRQQYQAQGKARKAPLRIYLGKMTGLSRAQAKRLIGQYLAQGSIEGKAYRPVSEVVLERKLDLPHGGGTGRRRVLVPPVRVRASQLHMVRSVEHLHAELEGLPFGDAEVFDGGEIKVNLSGTPQML